MVEDKDSFQAMIISRREEEFEELRRMRERRAAERKAQRKIDREIKRRQQFVRKARQQVEERVSPCHTCGLEGSLLIFGSAFSRHIMLELGVQQGRYQPSIQAV
jgi:hypothetical protein